MGYLVIGYTSICFIGYTAQDFLELLRNLESGKIPWIPNSWQTLSGKMKYLRNFTTLIMQCDVTSCVIFISNKTQYLEKEKR